MSVATAEQVLEALDFDTPVTVQAPAGSLLTYTVGNFTIEFAESVSYEVNPPTWEDNKQVTWESLTVKPKQCMCSLCNRHTGPMDPTVKALWVQALREPGRKQGRGALRVGDLWCALGVLVDVAIKHGVRLRQVVDPTNGATLYDGNGGALPPAVMTWAGLHGDPNVNGQAVSLLNDAGMPLRQIADLIEAHL